MSSPINRRAQGTYFEAKARVFLEKQGLKFIVANQTFKCGELDLVMQDKQTFIFVEVRQRKNVRFGSAIESITISKQQKWQKAANLWLAQRDLSLDTANCRFDLVTFDGENDPVWTINFLG